MVAPAHAEALVDLFVRNAVPSVTAGFDPFALDAAEARRIALAPGRDLFFVAAEGEELVGFSMLRGFEEGYEVPSFGIFVDHRQQGRGVGRSLTEWTIERAREHGCPAVRLSVYASNARARAMYDALGFVERERHELERDGHADEKIVMMLWFAG
jgi:[ribosomal protein S18]-alanine N-acetyltransferase